ncbi:MAG TPA: septal ring lytic transglycosylase RlpA family protein [Firmicutes bacterium]|nr:septal ring lytic transglycosylase RlpA family protein [Bacillota bacterium]
MSKYVCILLLFIFIASNPVTVLAGEVKVEVDGKTIKFNNSPLIEEMRILVPMRDFFSAMGAEIFWNSKIKTVCAVTDKIRVNIPVGSYLPTVNDVPVPIDVPAVIVDGRVYIPLRFAAESLGGRVSWDADNGRVIIQTYKRVYESRGEPRNNSEGTYIEKIDINTADAKRLEGIDGVSPEIAEEILAYRNAHGFYSSFEEISSLPSINDALYKKLRESVFIIYKEKGQGCYYGDEFHGSRTSSGEVYDRNLYTAAHRTLPFGTKVKVSFPKTGRSVWVRINDRGPHVSGRIIDISRSAANAIGLTPYGIGQLELEAIIEG